MSLFMTTVEDLVSVKVRSRLTFYIFLVGVGGSNFGVGFEEPAAVAVGMISTSLISKGLTLLEVLSVVPCGVCCFKMYERTDKVACVICGCSSAVNKIDLKATAEMMASLKYPEHSSTQKSWNSSNMENVNAVRLLYKFIGVIILTVSI
ncbi:hypothetical protein H5410_035273 [Solanum commersonii]|uniref:Uncharacterized protein n=1 Tax=Solanum commersonii TaxID=4109 RepID=A0A9J5Y0S0_SOLCO|nr:hypothetical protein H5410_035273 [Solanum commersonii]